MVGQKISHHEILEKLGEGRRGVAYKAEDIKLKRTITLKIFTSRISDESSAYRILKEAL